MSTNPPRRLRYLFINDPNLSETMKLHREWMLVATGLVVIVVAGLTGSVVILSTTIYSAATAIAAPMSTRNVIELQANELTIIGQQQQAQLAPKPAGR